MKSDLCKRTEHTQVGCGKHEIAKGKMRPTSKKRLWLNIKGIAAILTPIVFCQMRRPELQQTA